ncbi:hypothetical protein A3K34_04175 [candidate division WWE3 bacterium RIFOXYC1_FULL_40_10]|uniref:Phosphoglycerate kinase n=1 Tax=candidate division WWE3 bacterium RIFOXYA2_FULL_46_9 TaxID=1802636 RepID=A0A1F4W0U4_UNCKA|nr:MAG: hypothetical protein A3K58_04175 [candidate division WWE3 bacterium RIFOXYB1_FULL_40_22]OGC62038.1 MAG: hypothetical protein A3K37_04175 [candidate division WWE3 bacterium RIFOXYA1_FULL_40_11]OGC62955.1 MAG: hypothetical protein A2264_03690 [candidate division WWE3 bacterium RIFOXYA2_FULL_46_9]OGC65018.1 MAG: hypothetical protein A2326_03195 [candidate division WWE3 bacterium RIFOXYB2_FULL_41_6]OGC66421.1 MAG: hypothetical protein A3K34_04175 [candidate division WWE3 bacterium RIFOXYC1_
MRKLIEANIEPNTKVFVAADLDVVIKNGKILESYRLESLLPTLNFIIKAGATPVIGGHMGQPHGEYDEELSTKHLLPFFDENLGKHSFELLENLRFDKHEEENNLEYAKEIAHECLIYVNENFSTSHRKNASITQIPTFLPSYAGLHLQQEIETLEGLAKNPNRPLVAIVGGKKLESKIPAINKLINISDFVLVGGKLGLDWTGEIPQNLVLAQDYVDVSKDIGEETITLFKDKIKSAKTIVWAGPMGQFEDSRYTRGNSAVAEAIIDSGAFSIVGGGDTIAALDSLKLLDKMGFVSTGGGAMLELIATGTISGIEVL